MDTLSFPGLGISLPMNRVAISIGNFDIYWYGITFALAFLAGLLLYSANNKRCGIHPDEGLDVILWSCLGGIVGARLYYVAFEWESYKNNLLEIFNLRHGGIAIYGGVIGAVIVAYLVCRKRKLPFFAVADAAFPGVLLGQAIGRWGNFFNMEAFGGNTDLPWGMTSETIRNYLTRMQSTLAAQGMTVNPAQPVHPTFFYESLWNVVGVLLLMFLLMPRRKYDGEVTLGYTAWYGLGRFFVEGLRTDSLMWGNVRVSQALGGILFIAGTVLLIVFRVRLKNHYPQAEGEKRRFLLTRYVDTETCREHVAAIDARLNAKKAKSGENKPAEPADSAPEAEGTGTDTEETKDGGNQD